MTDNERDQMNVFLRIALEAQTWTAALKEVLIAKGITTDEEFAHYVAAAAPSRESANTNPLAKFKDLLTGFDGTNQ